MQSFRLLLTIAIVAVSACKTTKRPTVDKRTAGSTNRCQIVCEDTGGTFESSVCDCGPNRRLEGCQCVVDTSSANPNFSNQQKGTKTRADCIAEATDKSECNNCQNAVWDDSTCSEGALGVTKQQCARAAGRFFPDQEGCIPLPEEEKREICDSAQKRGLDGTPTWDESKSTCLCKQFFPFNYEDESCTWDPETACLISSGKWDDSSQNCDCGENAAPDSTFNICTCKPEYIENGVCKETLDGSGSNTDTNQNPDDSGDQNQEGDFWLKLLKGTAPIIIEEIFN